MSAYYDSMRRRAQDTGTELVVRPAAATVTVAPAVVDGGVFEPLREQLAARGNGRALQTLVFTGCSGSEACSGFVRDFGRSLASAGSRVAVVDLARARTGEGVLELADAVRSAAAPPTDALGRGRIAQCGTSTAHGEKEALLRSPAFVTWVAAQRAGFDYVLFAAPPVARYADALLLGRACDGVVLLVQSESTERTALGKAREQLERAGVHLVGAVLDGVRHEAPAVVRRYFGDD